MSDLDERREVMGRMAHDAHILASVTSAQLIAHSAEDQRMFKSIGDTLATIQGDVKGINKWIWIATGIMFTLSKSFDFLVQHGGVK